MKRKQKLVKHYHETGHLHEFTFSTYRRKPLLTNDRWRAKLARTLDQANQAEHMELVAFVFMPEHLHLLINPQPEKPNFGRYLALIKQPFSTEIKALLQAAGSPLLQQLRVQVGPDKEVFRIWQAGGGYDRNIYTTDAIRSSIEYIHNNPVRRGLCRHPTEWRWSSARYYLCDPPRQQFPDLPHVHGLLDGTLL